MLCPREEGISQKSVAPSRDFAIRVGLAGLMASRCKTQIGTDRRRALVASYRACSTRCLR